MIEEVDRMASENEISLESFVENEGENVQKDMIEESTNSSATQDSSKRAKGKKAKVIEDDVEGVKEALRYVRDCLLKCTSEIMNMNRIDGSEIWNLLEEMEVGDQIITSTYCFLVENPGKVKAILACPAQKRNDVLKIMMKTS